MLVDGAVVIVENVESHLSQPADQTRLPLLHVVYRAVREVTLPVASGIAIIIIVFFPLLTLEGLEGKLFIPVALTIVFALAASLVLALTVIPALASLLMGRAYQLGEAGIAELLVAQRQANEARLGANRARLAALEARYRVYVDAHLLWDADED